MKDADLLKYHMKYLIEQVQEQTLSNPNGTNES